MQRNRLKIIPQVAAPATTGNNYLLCTILTHQGWGCSSEVWCLAIVLKHCLVTSPPEGWEVLSWTCPFVCLLAYLENQKVDLLHFGTRGRDSDDPLTVSYLLSVWWMTSCFHTMGPVGPNQARRCISSSSFICSINIKQSCTAMQYSGAGQQGPRKDTDSWSMKFAGWRHRMDVGQLWFGRVCRNQAWHQRLYCCLLVGRSAWTDSAGTRHVDSTDRRRAVDVRRRRTDGDSTQRVRIARHVRDASLQHRRHVDAGQLVLLGHLLGQHDRAGRLSIHGRRTHRLARAQGLHRQRRPSRVRSCHHHHHKIL